MKLFIFMLISFLYLSVTYSQNNSMEDLQTYAFDNLKDRMEDSTFWNKVHSIEFMIELGENKIVDSLLENHLSKFETEPQKRIGYWRCMAMNENDLQTKQIFIKKILEVFLNSNNSDVIHAAESLAKLSYSLVPYTDSKLFDREQSNLLEAYVNWASIYSESNESSIYYDRLFKFLNSENDEYREIMAYGTKYLGMVDSCNWNRLADYALNESTESVVGVYLLCGAYVICPHTERNNSKTKIIGDRIKEIAKGDNLKNKYEAFIALGSFASPCDTYFIKKELLGFVSNKSNKELSEKALDVLSAISYAFLKATSYKSNK